MQDCTVIGYMYVEDTFVRLMCPGSFFKSLLMFNTPVGEFYFTQCLVSMAFSLKVVIVHLGSGSMCVASTTVLAIYGPQT
jgi:hypothetical protein